MILCAHPKRKPANLPYVYSIYFTAPPVSGIAVASSALVNPAQMVKAPPNTQAKIAKLADCACPTTLAALKKTPAPITVPITVDNAPNVVISLFNCFFSIDSLISSKINKRNKISTFLKK